MGTLLTLKIPEILTFTHKLHLLFLNNLLFTLKSNVTVNFVDCICSSNKGVMKRVDKLHGCYVTAFSETHCPDQCQIKGI